ncbi:hypothetical protein HRR83_001482 [Exophiala dermatitidis]|uniref:chitinase n=2 Tax=Exophiala dermatitidis TaxID=5970 RepID=H6C6A2_EXODN|nr:chitinase [Exophiala dermatitidis NIH/UT8656]KAJ4522972.1 hypothetical protein HRR75_001368 [Exophiala dermatitidis]EHY59248.1 chitinase [Exophiala dermatitidis NIH/UT8656]KAJ4526291.1 hypothetical protein HRR74_001486 [Exophiala dermatitidis]KAJ4526766.1 hypothetical protein HRR73_001561 [Exophiala dermatitidis]KAJ4532471.1 hypothetical protein HRR76_007464 [Exophiala dermatitidis]
MIESFRRPSSPLCPFLLILLVLVALCDGAAVVAGSGIDRRSPATEADTSSTYTFNPLATNLNIVYYGQSNITADVSLDQICADDSVDVVILGFIRQFYGSGGKNNKSINITLDFAGDLCSSTASSAQVEAGQPGLLDCVSTGFADRIASCQTKGKKVLISAGSASGDLYIPSKKDAGKLATMLWNLFLGGTSDGKTKDLRPFGMDVVLDGFDLDNENATNAKYLPNLISSLRKKMKKDKAKPKRQYYVSAAPICALESSSSSDQEIPVSKLINDIDFWNVQFYNAQACQVGSCDGFTSSLKQWSEVLLNGRKVKCEGSTCTVPKGKFNTIDNGITYPRLLIGSRSFYTGVENRGYVDPQTYSDILKDDVKTLDLPNLAGAMWWDGTYLEQNKEEVEGLGNVTFAEVVREVL